MVQVRIVLLLAMLLQHSSATTGQKILVLHGGGQSALAMDNSQGMNALEVALSSHTFVYADAPGEEDVWMRDPPSKSQPTNDRYWDQERLDYLDHIVQQQGPFQVSLPTTPLVCYKLLSAP